MGKSQQLYRKYQQWRTERVSHILKQVDGEVTAAVQEISALEDGEGESYTEAG